MTPSGRYRRLIAVGILIAVVLGLWTLRDSASATGRLLIVGGERNGCHCTQRIEP
jgi:hypothetical protein